MGTGITAAGGKKYAKDNHEISMFFVHSELGGLQMNRRHHHNHYRQ